MERREEGTVQRGNAGEIRKTVKKIERNSLDFFWFGIFDDYACIPKEKERKEIKD